MVQSDKLDALHEQAPGLPPPPSYAPPANSSYGPSVSAPPLHVMLELAQERDDMLVPSPTGEGDRSQHAYGASMPTLGDMPARGSKVTISGLMAHYDLNGKEGTVVDFRADGAVIVDIPSAGVSGAPVHTENLVWGEYASLDIAAPSFMAPKMNTTEFEGKRIIRVRPPRRVKSDATCCPGAFGWSDMTFFKNVLYIWSSFLIATMGFALWFCTVFFIPFTCGHVAVLTRWLCHRQLDVLLTASPPRRGIVVTHPMPLLVRGGCMGYISHGHTWRCIAYAPLAFAVSMGSVIAVSVILFLGFIPCVRPLYAVLCNISAAMLWTERSLAVCLLAHVVGEYDAVCDLLDAPAPTTESQVVRTYGSAGQEPTAAERQEEGVSRDEPTHARSWLVPRGRSLEEQLAAEKFHSTFLKLFGRPARLQDIIIQPPREPGRGPRHFVTLADTVDDSNRLKLIKSYKQMFSTMYVHIVDIEEQQRQGGTDYSEMYS